MLMASSRNRKPISSAFFPPMSAGGRLYWPSIRMARGNDASRLTECDPLSVPWSQSTCCHAIVSAHVCGRGLDSPDPPGVSCPCDVMVVCIPVFAVSVRYEKWDEAWITRAWPFLLLQAETGSLTNFLFILSALLCLLACKACYGGLNSLYDHECCVSGRCLGEDVRLLSWRTQEKCVPTL